MLRIKLLALLESLPEGYPEPDKLVRKDGRYHGCTHFTQLTLEIDDGESMKPIQTATQSKKCLGSPRLIRTSYSHQKDYNHPIVLPLEGKGYRFPEEKKK